MKAFRELSLIAGGTILGIFGGVIDLKGMTSYKGVSDY